jgi:tetratricopeptide (TPR) repeat protein
MALVRPEACVFESENRLRHLPFFEEIASHDEAHPEWRAASAGLVVLRLVDAWLEEGPELTSDDAWTIRGVRNAIGEVAETTPIRSLLGRVVDALQTRKPDIHVVVTPLMAYAQALEYDAKWVLAADVYHSVLAHLHPVEDGDASVAAHLRLGQCYRYLHRIDDAVAAFTSASEIATAVGDIVGVLRARTGEARIAILKGNWPRAEQLLDETIARAVGSDLSDVRSRALHDRSEVARKRGEYEFAIRLAYDALAHSESPTEKDRILADIAVAFLDLGVLSAARDAYLVLFATAQEQYLRWAAALNLLEISSLSGEEIFFEQYRRHLNGANLPPLFATAYALNTGLGYHRFGNIEHARAHLQRAMALAEEHGINDFLFQAEEALFALTSPPKTRPNRTAIPLDLQEVAGAIRHLRETAGVS